MDKYVPVTLILKLYFHVFITGLEATFLFTLIIILQCLKQIKFECFIINRKGLYLMLMYLLCILKTLLQMAGFGNYTILTDNI